MNITIDINTPIFTQPEILEVTGIKAGRMNNILARLREIVPKLGGRPGPGERRRFSIADNRLLWIIDNSTHLIGDMEAAKAAVALGGRIWGPLEYEPHGCLAVVRRFGPLPPGGLNSWDSDKFDHIHYHDGPPGNDHVFDTIALIPYGQLIKQADDACQGILNGRRDKAQPNVENDGEVETESE